MARNWNTNETRSSSSNNRRSINPFSSSRNEDNYSRNMRDYDDETYSTQRGSDNDYLDFDSDEYEDYVRENRIFDRDRSLNRDYSTYGGTGYNNRSRRADYSQPMEMNYGRDFSTPQRDRYNVDQRSSSSSGGFYGEMSTGNNRRNYMGQSQSEDNDYYGSERSTFGSSMNQDRSQGGYRGVGPRSYRKSDERLKDDICERLMDHEDIDAQDIEIEVKDGEVTLSGTVSDKWMKYQAEDIIEKLSFVNNVNNEIRVSKSKDKDQSATDDDSIGFKASEKTKKADKKQSQH